MFRVRQQVGCTGEVVEFCKGRNFIEDSAVRVALLDTGIGNHPDFEGRILAFKDFLHGVERIYDDSGHGTCSRCIGEERLPVECIVAFVLMRN